MHTKTRIGVVGAGAFGANHLRIINQSAQVALAGIVDVDLRRAAELAAAYECPIFGSLEELAANAEAAVIASPTVSHSQIGCRLMELGLDILVEKPLALNPVEGWALVETAKKTGRMLHTGLLERFNPVVTALSAAVTTPLFFEIQRLGKFKAKSLDIDVVLDLMIHDIDVVLSLVREVPGAIHAAGISVLTDKIDIANARLEFPSGCVANLTASRVHIERVRKLRVFQKEGYISLDYTRKEAIRCRVKSPVGLEYEQLHVSSAEPLRLELEHFFESIILRTSPRVTPEQALAALTVACDIRDTIARHARRIGSLLPPGGEFSTKPF